MKIRLLVVTLISALALGTGFAAQDSKSKEEHTELGERMEKMGGAWRAIKRQIADASKNEDTLKRLAVVKENMEASLKFDPEITKEKPAADRAKFVSDYQARMKEQIAKVDEIIAAVKAGKNADAEKLVATVDQDQKDSHKQFKKQKKKQ